MFLFNQIMNCSKRGSDKASVAVSGSHERGVLVGWWGGSF